jgi:hypothetical protein
MADSSGKNGGMSPASIFFLILAFLGVGAPLMLSTARPTSSTTILNSNVASTSGYANSAEKLLEEFFNADPDQFIDATHPWHGNAPIYPGPNESWRDDDPRRNDKISYLVATLPNPQNPSLRYEFDRYIDSIQLALGHENFFLVKTDLPWVDQPTTKRGSTDTSAGAPSDQRRPGVMLFWRADTGDSHHPARDSLMVVFVVGESPTSGVDAAALRSALDQVAWLHGWSGSGDTPAPAHLAELTRDNPKNITILGPTYSGSATSMQEVLRSWLHYGGLAQSPPHISLLSGTATAIEAWPPELGDLHSTQLLENQLYQGIVTFFQQDLGNPRIAILTDDTDYGSSIAKLYQRKIAQHDTFGGVTLLPYPIHISNVRTAYETSRAQQPNPATTPLGLGHRDPPIPDEDPGQDNDFVPSFSRASAANDEVVLSKLLETIHREDFHYVGIVATDIQDAIFLIREIRDNCPDTIPFLTSADLLYLHSDFNRELAGTLIFSTYPLFASNQLWTWPSNLDYRRLQFPSGETQGVYNAVLAALDDSKLMVEYTLPFSSASEVPPLWVSVVGNDALWPVSLALTQSNPIVFARTHPQPGAAKFLPRNFGMNLYPQQFDITFTLVILLCTLPHLYLMQRYPIKGAGIGRLYRAIGRVTPRAPRWLERLLDDLPNVNRSNRRLSLISFVLVLLTFFIIASSVWILPLRAMSLWSLSNPTSSFSTRLLDTIRNNGQLLAWTVIPTLLASGLIFFGIAGLTANTIKHPDLLGARASWTARYTFSSSIIGVLFALVLAVSIWLPQPLKALIYFVRAANLWNGVSPLLPMLFIGLAALWLSVSELWRLALSEEYVLNDDFLGFHDAGSFTGIHIHERSTVRFLQCSTDDIPFWRLWLTLPFVIYLLLDTPGLKLVALDGRIFNLFLIGVAIFVYTWFLLLFGRFVAVWLELRALLRRLYVHPTRRAYEELRTGSVAPSMADRQRIWLFEPADSVTAIEFCLERVREMLRQVEPATGASSDAAPAFPAGTIASRLSAERVALADLVEEIQPTLNTILRDEAGGKRRAVIEGKTRLQLAMSKLSHKVTAIFEPWWRLDPQVHLTVAGDKAGLDESLIKDAELFVASRVVDFLRQVFPQLMNLVIFASVGLLALMLAVSSYPFPQRDTVASLSWIILLSVIGVTFGIFIQINRDRVVSTLSGTTPGELNWNSSFVWQLVVFGIIPILTLLGAQFPHALQGVFSSFGGVLGGAH